MGLRGDKGKNVMGGFPPGKKGGGVKGVDEIKGGYNTNGGEKGKINAGPKRVPSQTEVKSLQARGGWVQAKTEKRAKD